MKNMVFNILLIVYFKLKIVNIINKNYNKINFNELSDIFI